MKPSLTVTDLRHNDPIPITDDGWLPVVDERCLWAASQRANTFQLDEDLFFDSRRGNSMNPMDILGSLLGGKRSSGGKGGDILTEMLGRKSRPSAPSRSSKTSRSTQPTSVDQMANELEDLLNVANDQHSEPADPAPSRTSTAPSRRGSSERRTPQFDEKAVVLIRAMIGAAKADGRLDSEEQDKIVNQLRDPTPDAIQFLREEFGRTASAREFAMSVPVGMEQQVYTLSLIAIDLDTSEEAKYIKELGDLLRLSPEVRDQIHQRIGAPSVY